MNFDKIFDLTAGVYFYFYNILYTTKYYYIYYCGRCFDRGSTTFSENVLEWPGFLGDP